MLETIKLTGFFFFLALTYQTSTGDIYCVNFQLILNSHVRAIQVYFMNISRSNTFIIWQYKHWKGRGRWKRISAQARRNHKNTTSRSGEPTYSQGASKPNPGWSRLLVTSTTTAWVQPRASWTRSPVLGGLGRNRDGREAERTSGIFGHLVSLASLFCQRAVRRDVYGFRASRWRQQQQRRQQQQSMWSQCHAVSRRQLGGKPHHLATKIGIPGASASSRPTAAAEFLIRYFTMIKIHLLLLSLPRMWTLRN